MADQPSLTGPTATSGEEQALALAKDLVEQHAPWKRGIPWHVVLLQGIVLAVAGAVLWLAPGTGALAMQVLALTLLGSAVVSAWRLIRGSVAPRRSAIVGFRAGVGITVGVLAILGTLLAGGTDAHKVALGIVLGTGFVLYGLASATAALVGRDPGSRLPFAGLILALGTAVMGVWLIIQANTGVDALRGTFSTLGLLVLIAGGLLAAWAYYLKTHPTLPAEP